VFGVGQVSLLRLPGQYIVWTGLNAYNGIGVTTAGGYSPSLGATIIFIDYAHLLAVEVAGPDAIRIHNTSSFDTDIGSVSLMW
jgi:glycine cleavage system aminomethyltransferase T